MATGLSMSTDTTASVATQSAQSGAAAPKAEGTEDRDRPDGITRQIHMCLCVRGALRWTGKNRLAGLFTHPDGRECTAAEAKEYLKLCDWKGWRVIPMGDCDNFDYETGCRGHVIPSVTSVSELRLGSVTTSEK